jgi:hypothetical protein
MGTDDDAEMLFATALNLSRTAFAGQHYAVAYYALAAALHAANDLGNDQYLVEVGEAAGEQNQWLNDHDPDHELAEYSAASRGSKGLWTTLQREVVARRRMLAQRRLIQKMQPDAQA